MAMSMPQSGTDTWPYISFRTLFNTIERFAEIGLGNRIDKSTLSNLSYGMIPQVIGTLKWLGLIAGDGTPLPDLVTLVEQPEQRKAKIAEILREHYRGIFARDLAKITPDELEQELAGIGGDTKRKAATFFVHAAAYAEIPMSPLLAMKFKVQQSGTPRRSGAGTRVRRKKPLGKGDTATQQSQQAGQVVPSNFRSMVLEDGGVLGLTLAGADLFGMSKRDRDFVLSLVDQMATHEQSIPKAAPESASEPAGAMIGA